MQYAYFEADKHFVERPMFTWDYFCWKIDRRLIIIEDNASVKR